jgi:hypothetical protein
MATETKAAMSADTTAAIPQLAAERLHVEIIPGTEATHILRKLAAMVLCTLIIIE